MAIYTRTGDSGSTSLFTGQRVSKTHLRVETYGTLDELNATLSLCYCATAIESHRILLEVIQQQIFWFSAELASESEQPSAQQRYIGTEEIAALENAIDSAMNAVPQFTASFCLVDVKLQAACISPARWLDGLKDVWLN